MTYDLIPVIPTAPVVSDTYATCVDGTWTVEPALVSLTPVTNGRWVNPDPTSESNLLTSLDLTNVAPGEYTYQFVTAEGPFSIPESPDGGYRLENGVANFTITISSFDPQACTVDEAVTPGTPAGPGAPSSQGAPPAGTQTATTVQADPVPTLAATGLDDISPWTLVIAFALVSIGAALKRWQRAHA